MYSKLKPKISIFLLVFFPWCQGISLPVPSPNQQLPDRTSLPLERVFEEDQNSFVSEEDFNQELRGYQSELPQPLEEEGYWARNENLQSQPMPKGEEDGGISEELRSRINCQARNDQVSQIDCLAPLALQATQQRGYGSDEFSSQIDQASQSEKWDQSEKIIDNYKADTHLVKSNETWNNYDFPQENTNVDSQRSGAPKIANENDWDRSSDENGKITGKNPQRYFPYEIRGREVWERFNKYGTASLQKMTTDRDSVGNYVKKKIDDTKVMPGVKDVQERGYKEGFGSKKSRKGKKSTGRTKKWKKRNRKGNKVVRRISSSSFQNRRATAEKKIWNRGRKKSKKEEKKNGTNKIQISEDDPEFTSNRRDNWKKWHKGALDFGKADGTDDTPGIQDNQEEVWYKLDDENRNDGDTDILQTDNDNRRDSMHYDESSSGNMGEESKIQDSQENDSGNLDSEEVNNEIPATVPVTVSNRRDGWKKWDRVAKNSGETDEKPEFQDNQKEERKKWDNVGENGGNIQKPPDSQSSRRDDWKKWDH